MWWFAGRSQVHLATTQCAAGGFLPPSCLFKQSPEGHRVPKQTSATSSAAAVYSKRKCRLFYLGVSVFRSLPLFGSVQVPWLRKTLKSDRKHEPDTRPPPVPPTKPPPRLCELLQWLYWCINPINYEKGNGTVDAHNVDSFDQKDKDAPRALPQTRFRFTGTKIIIIFILFGIF